jgi:hypothetical protein
MLLSTSFSSYSYFQHPSAPTAALQPSRKRVNLDVSRNGAPAAKSAKAVVCKYYLSGRCSKFDCPFLHDIPPVEVSRFPSSSSRDVENSVLEKDNNYKPAEVPKRDAAAILPKYSVSKLVDPDDIVYKRRHEASHCRRKPPEEGAKISQQQESCTIQQNDTEVLIAGDGAVTITRTEIAGSSTEVSYNKTENSLYDASGNISLPIT